MQIRGPALTVHKLRLPPAPDVIDAGKVAEAQGVEDFAEWSSNTRHCSQDCTTNTSPKEWSGQKADSRHALSGRLAGYCCWKRGRKLDELGIRVFVVEEPRVQGISYHTKIGFL